MSNQDPNDEFAPENLGVRIGNDHPLLRPIPKSARRGRVRGLFIKGPIPLNWKCAVDRISGNAARLADAMWFRAGVKRATTFQLNLSRLEAFGLNRFSASRALIALERAGLVSVERHSGRNPTITILECEAGDCHERLLN